MGLVGLKPVSTSTGYWSWARLKLFFSLSRTPHGIIDMASPALAALLAMGFFPSFWVTLLGLFTAFSGYTAVYALNDVVDLRNDREKMRSGKIASEKGDLDAILARHPMAQGLLSFKEGFLWTCAWGALSLLGAYLLNPVCLSIFFAACLLEILYCLLWRITPFRAVINGLVKTAGPLAAVFAVDPDPSTGFLAILFLFFFFWEIGGQNIPNDWTDLEKDRHFGAKTIPIAFGQDKSARAILVSLAAATIISLFAFLLSPSEFPLPFYLMIPGIGGILLLWPAWRLNKRRREADAMRLFNLASYYPLSLLLLTVVNLSV